MRFLRVMGFLLLAAAVCFGQSPDSLTNSALDWGKVWLIPESRLQVAAEDPAAASELQQRLLRHGSPG